MKSAVLLFPVPEQCGVSMRTLQPAASRLTIVWIPDLMGADTLERLVLQPLSRGVPTGGPAAQAESGLFPAPVVQVVTDGPHLRKGLYEGLIAVHTEGHASVLLLGNGRAADPVHTFGPDLGANVALVRRRLAVPDLRVERLESTDGACAAVIYLASRAAPAILPEIRAWARNLKPKAPESQWWQALLDLYRMPVVTECSPPQAAAELLRRGYVAVLSDHHPCPLMAPNTLELLLTGPQDLSLPPAVRRVAGWGRLGVLFYSLSVAPGFVAVTSYHHALMPGPFLVALASGRQNLPFPIAIEMLLILLLDDLMVAAAGRIAGQRWVFLGILGTALTATAALQAGVVAPVPVVIGITCTASHQMLSNPTLSRTLRLWRYLFIGAAAGLGVWGIALLFFAVMIHVATARSFGHPVRCAPVEVIR